jgi:hypothetical protein
MNGPGRIRTRVRRAFIAAGDRELTTSEILAWVYPRGGILHNQQRRRVREAAGEFAERVRLERRGRSFVILWRAVGPVERARARHRPTGRLWHGWPPTDGFSAHDD